MVAVHPLQMSFALTFDDGPGPSTKPLLDALDHDGVRATFFVLGRNLEGEPWAPEPGGAAQARSLALQVLRAGHQLGNHSYWHVHPPIHPDVFLAEVDRMDEIIRQLRREAGMAVDSPIPVRLPYGAKGDDDLRPKALALRGRRQIDWTEMFGDWSPRSADDIAREMIAHVADRERIGLNSTLLLHDGGIGKAPLRYDRPATVEAVQIFLAEARKCGWKDTLV